ncbi:AAA family ATPase [Avibacterium sp. 21-599]|uniref:AAA family ATPase n=1 Tax=Avibacterium sp. 21-599 TaxID=2911528 RepID=UPI00224591BD|nr:AAA family ATPase [Avibacterium sp. 21-599]MCW9718294.1 AAA family ATPase [Avibacterium sp. 21-599]
MPTTQYQYVKYLQLDNFSCLPNETFNFSKHLNIIIAENGCGKSHLLKILYTLLETGANEKNKPIKSESQKVIADKLLSVFRPDSLGRLVKRQQGRSRTEVTWALNGGEKNKFSFSSNSSTQVNIDNLEYTKISMPVFIPTRELITLCPWFISLYQNQDIPFEEIWLDTCLLLNHPLAKGPRTKKIKELLEPIESALEGTVIEENGRFYLKQTTQTGKIEAPLVAEGLRKFVMIARLVATGALLNKGYLFWDEPEANLNPKLIKVAAKIIYSLVKQKIQVFISTHSLFLLRELELLNIKEKLKTRYFSLYFKENTADDFKENTADVALEQANHMHDLKNIVSLDESLKQSDRYLGD